MQELLQLEPDNTRGLGLLGSLELQLGHNQVARNLFKKAIAAAPKHVANYHSLARLELLEGNIDEARKLFAQGLELQPKNVYVLQVGSAQHSQPQCCRETLECACRPQEPGQEMTADFTDPKETLNIPLFLGCRQTLGADRAMGLLSLSMQPGEPDRAAAAGMQEACWC